MKRICTLTLGLLLTTLSIVKADPAYNFFGDPLFLLGPVGQSLGGAGFALKLPHDDLFLNPAAGAFSSEYDVDASFSTAGRTLAATVFDTKSTSFGAGLHYVRREVNSDDTTKVLRSGSLINKYQAFGLSLFGKLHEKFAVGITGRMSDRSGTPVGTGADGKSWNGDIGAAFKPLPGLTLGAVYKNIFGDKKNLELRELAAGISYEAMTDFTLSGAIEKFSATSSDPNVDVPLNDKLTWSLAGEYSLTGTGVAIRGAYRDAGPWKSQLILAGLGYTKDNFHIDYALALATKGDKFSTHTFGLGMSF